jgi:citrate synthase
MDLWCGRRRYVVNIDCKINMMPAADRRFLSAGQAAAALGVTRPTLYAYTSRGQLHSEPVPGRSRERRYLREEVERLRERKELRRDPARAAEQGLHWGSPVLTSRITLIENGRFYYRGQDALTLSDTATLEDAALLLWAADPSERIGLFTPPHAVSVAQIARLRRFARDPITLFQMALPLAAATDSAGHDLRPAAVRRTGARIIRLFTAIASRREATVPAHAALQSGWALRGAAVGDAIRSALVLCADHELNVSAFTARCAASAGASPYDTVAAATATLKGGRHGGETARVSALLEEVRTPERARDVVAGRLRRGERVPGFGHPLYPAGDPRAVRLLQIAEAGARDRDLRVIRSVQRAVSALLHDEPNLDFGLTALARAYRLPDRAPLVLFALGRTAGWIAHAIEQYGTTDLIRPRARYAGPPPAR